MRVSDRRESAPPALENRLLASENGELLCVQYAVEPRLLEETLEALAHAPFPINPELRHPAPGEGSWRTVIQFPVYAAHVESLAKTLRAYGLDPQALAVSPMLESLVPAAG